MRNAPVFGKEQAGAERHERVSSWRPAWDFSHPKGARLRMTLQRIAAGAFIIGIASLTPSPAQPSTTQPAAAERVGSDPAYIGPKSWQRHFTIPEFVETPKGLTIKGATSRPADALSEPASYWASRSRRTEADTSSGGTAGSSSGRSSERSGDMEGYSGRSSSRRSSRGEGGYSERSSRSSRSERGSRSSRSERGSRSSRSSRY